jgi:hypothetical protein
MEKKTTRKTSSLNSYIQKLNGLLEKFNLGVRDGKVVVIIPVGDDEFTTISADDFEFSYFFEDALAHMFDAAGKAAVQTDYLAAARLMAGTSNTIACIISNFTDSLTKAVETLVIAGEYVPKYALEPNKKALTSQTYTEEWLKKYYKYIALRPELRVARAMFFGKGYVNRGSVDYSDNSSSC